MDKKKLAFGIWLMTMALVALSAFTIYFIAQMRYSVLFCGYLTLVVLQLFALTVFLVGDENIKHVYIRIIYRLCCLSSLAVVPAFCFIFSALTSQYHAKIKDTISVSYEEYEKILPQEDTTIYETDSLYIIFPKYSKIDLVCEKRPKKSDKSITWCSGAAFQHDISLGFSHLNVEGYHACNGEYFDSPYIHDNSAGFASYDDNFKFEFENPETVIKEAAANGGSGFMQFGIIKDGEVIYSFSRTRSYRLLAELNGNLCIIDSKEMMNFEDFLSEVQKLHVTNALYMDMGAGWNYSWFRNQDNRVKTLFSLKVPWAHNWIVFRE